MRDERIKSYKETIRLVIQNRCSVRHFLDQKIDRSDLDMLIEAAVAAPSGSNWQNQRFLVIDDPSEILRIGRERFVWPYKNANQEKIKKSHPGGILGHSAALIIVFSDSKENDRRGNGEYYIWETLETQNCSASIENILIMATSMGIGTCWVSASDKMNYTRMFSGKSWRSVFSNYRIPEHYKLQGIVICGYPKSVDEMGLPKGESMHGATVWQSTKRRPIQDYMIGKRSEEDDNIVRPSMFHKLLVRSLSMSIKQSIRIAKICDRIIHRIEVRTYMKP